ncbi:MAG: ornithine carbamoyltransferase [Thermoflexales bacterium]|nr:ornithine carbamoyltransferase [Thermoflexales bacterium]MCS7324101.1 ornithine carbamoyltransferase [Thermoflexales bacterium]MDW8054538.1 ornithine carbamoyltransferase [Anaerolineae bacterium]MDW8292843.1 ornithine carbamoyltransferase [Anaerolineae bacterium]
MPSRKIDLRGRDFISDLDFSIEEVEAVLDLAARLKKEYRSGKPHSKEFMLRDKTLALLFFFTSTRTRGSFEAGMAQLGGHAAFIDSDTTQIAHGDTAKEIGQIFGRYFNGIAIRQCDWGFGNRYINEVAQHSPVPVLNMQCDVYHPFQILADLMTLREYKGKDLRGKKIAVSWAYAASYQKPISVPQSLIIQLTRFGMDVVLAHPPEYRLMPEIVQIAEENAKASGGSFAITHDMDEAFKDADAVYPKSWGALLTTTDPNESAEIGKRYKDWICDERRMSLAKPDAIYMHCLPADRGLEVTDAVIDGPQSVVYEQAENRLHVQKAVMIMTLGDYVYTPARAKSAKRKAKPAARASARARR